MNARRRFPNVATVPPSRWVAYATASAVTALVGAHSAEAEIHYSGIVNHRFVPPGSVATFPLDPGVSLHMAVGIPRGGTESGGFGHVTISGAGSAFAASHPLYAGVYLYALPKGIKLSHENFANSCRFNSSSSRQVCYGGTIGGGPGNFQSRGTEFIGFSFNSGAGVQYGWARVKTSGPPDYRFVVVDYAWGDPGDKLRAGQTASPQAAPAVAAEGSLGVLAAGAAGLMAWRGRKRKNLAKAS